MTQQYPEPPVYGQNAQPQDENQLPGQNDPSQARASLEAAMATQRERTGYAPGEDNQSDEGDRYPGLPTLDDLMAEAERDITNFKEMDLPEEYRPGWSFVVDCIIPGPQLERYTTQSHKKGQRGPDAEIDPTVLNCRILLNHVTEIRKNGQPLLDAKGKPVRLNSPEFIRSMGRETAIDAIRRFLWDSHIGHLSDAIMREAGYSRDGGRYVQVKQVDPTRG